MARYRGCSCDETRGRTSAYFGELVHEPIENRIAKGGGADQVMPVVDRHLAGDQRGPSVRGPSVLVRSAIGRYIRPTPIGLPFPMDPKLARQR